ncbi:MAG: DNA recombination protein RmuC [Gammaproteobacteria bacterium]|nr:DNA recombination protein RmuC [Gammaproteobacteria bacterium]
MDILFILPALAGAITAGVVTWWLVSTYFRQREVAIRHAATLSESALDNRVENLQKALTELQSSLSKATLDYETQRDDNLVLREQAAELRTTLEHEKKQASEKLALLENAKEKMNAEFKNIANEIFENKQKVFSERSREQLDGLLKPLSERIKDFEKKVEETYDKESKERFSLVKEVRNLQRLNARISEDAINLTNALKGQSKTQGTWGEIILERVLEKSGLEKGREYEIQVSLKNEDGRRLQPDVIVHLPEGKDVIIDSKVSLTAYERYCSVDDEAEKNRELNLHIQSLRSHIKGLGDKDYQKLESVNSLDFVLLFIPIEAAFSLAVQHDGDLVGEAFDKNIVLVAPSTLLATLRTIQNIWRYEQQNRNAQKIANTAGRLYDKFVNFVQDVEEIGSRIDAAQKAYDKAHNKLVSGRGNLINRAEAMRELGAKVSKSLPQHLVGMDEADADHEKPSDKIRALPATE